MKLWQLASIVENINLIISTSASRDEWHYLTPWFSEIAEYYKRRDRNVLDAKLPPDFVRRVLEESGLVCYAYDDGTIRSYKTGGFKALPAVDVYVKYGGDVLERLFERSIVGDISDDLAIREILEKVRNTHTE